MVKAPIIAIKDGQLRGTEKVDWLGGKYYSFQGIPYAKPPVGNLRFKEPQPVEPWQGVKDATKEGSDCYSRHLFTQQFIGSEDCLFLNVYTPQLPSNNAKLKPVMLWIHGGAFMGGSGSTEFYGPDFLVAEDVVIVTINYRVGLLGFSCFTDPSLEATGNTGLKDQVLALKWVQKNISQFSGDPNNVTVFGESAGGACAHMLMLSPLAKGLFHRVISQSGVIIARWARGQPTAPLISKVLGLEDKSEADVLKILTHLPIEKLLEVQEKLPDNAQRSQSRAYGVVIEPVGVKSAFLTRDPQDILKSGDYYHVPLMIGYTSREGMLLEHFQKITFGEVKWLSTYEEFVPPDFQHLKDSAFSNEITEKITKFYYDSGSRDNIDQFYLTYTDTYFFIDINNVVRLQTNTSRCPIYYYRMSVETRLNTFKKLFSLKTAGVAHGDDIGYLFKNLATPEIRPNSPEDIGLRRFIKLWTTFARTGDPNPAKKDKIVNVTWLPTEKDKLNYLEIGENLTVGVNPDYERIEFWDEIIGLISDKIKKL